MNLKEVDDKPVTAFVYYVTQNMACTWRERQWHDVFMCTLLHHELRDYSLGQIAFAVFQALFAITQLLCHVSALLTSAC